MKKKKKNKDELKWLHQYLRFSALFFFNDARWLKWLFFCTKKVWDHVGISLACQEQRVLLLKSIFWKNNYLLGGKIGPLTLSLLIGLIISATDCATY